MSKLSSHFIYKIGSSSTSNGIDESKFKELFEKQFGEMDIATGANGISGFLPDWDKPTNIPVTLSQNNTLWVMTSDVIPQDGWVYVSFQVKDATIGTTYVWFRVNNSKPIYVVARNGSHGMYLPVRKGDIVSAASNAPYLDTTPGQYTTVIHYPIYKPELNEEHIVGYLNGKPVYEKTIDAFSSSIANSANNIADVSSLSILKLIKIEGVYHTGSGVMRIGHHYHYQTSPEQWTNVWVSPSDAIHLKEAHSVDALNSLPMTICIRYTKTTD